MPDVFERVHHAGVPAAQQHHKPVRGIEEQRLVVHQRIGLGAGGVEKEASAGVLEGILAGNLAGHEDAIQTSVGSVVQTTALAAPDWLRRVASSMPMGRPVPSGLAANFGAELAG